MKKKLEYECGLFDSDNGGSIDKTQMKDMVTSMVDFLEANKEKYKDQESKDDDKLSEVIETENHYDNLYTNYYDNLDIEKALQGNISHSLTWLSKCLTHLKLNL